jgi:hypothetical protein
MEKKYEIFIASVKKMPEREKVRNAIWAKGDIASGMERFEEYNYSIDEIKKCIDECDVVILVCSFVYGGILYKVKCSKCPLKFTNKKECENFNKKGNCGLSFTHFEYLYAKTIKKEVYPFILKNIEDSALRANYIKNNPEVKDDPSDWANATKFVKIIKEGGNATLFDNIDALEGEVKSKIEYIHKEKHEILTGYLKGGGGFERIRKFEERIRKFEEKSIYFT